MDQITTPGVSKLPAGWTWKTMADIAEVIGGGTPKTNDSSNYEGGNIPWITPADLSGYSGKYIGHGERYITEKGLKNSSARMMPAGTILFSSRAPVGYVAIASNSVCTNQGFKSFVLKESDVLPDYVYWWLKGNKDLAESMASGTTFLELSGAKAKQLPIPIARLNDQKRIVAEIEKQFSRLDEAVAGLKRVKANLKRYKAAVLKAAVEGKLTEEWRKTHTGIGSAKNRWENKAAELKDDANPKLPKTWVYKKLKDISERVSVGHVGPTSEFYCNKEIGIPFIRSQNVRPGRLDYDGMQYITKEFHDQLKKSQLRPGDLLVVRVGANRGDCCSVPAGVGPINCANIVFARPFAGIADYLQLYFQTKTCQKILLGMSTGSAQGVINTKSVAEVPVPIPPEKEQLVITAEVESRLSNINMHERMLEHSLARTERLLQAVLRAAFSGKIN